ncbi:aldolase/citrate lyase family protein [Amycolatopsis sp.]|jgi:4-hydroxy-2-oxoheptanedioate aldolase|uniref:HpcH/HpaI aldolase family protein n=1 Tax=Amycolatopsis sp. TaxID=37632 RepID=UPI002610575E|nr:aldolase/citrate lyase family protein [Amycolatopsis sp.]
MVNTPVVAERLALVGHDYVCLDQQHGIVDDANLVASILAISAGGSAPLVRVAANEPSLISKALDCGAAGVIVPLVNDRRDAERAVQSCNYPPDGDRSIGPIRQAPGRPACIVMAESKSAVNNIDEICAVRGVDAVYVGPADLAASLGCAPSLGVTPGVHAEAVAAILAGCARHGIVTGIHCGTTEQAIECAGMGFQMITISTDVQLLTEAATLRFDEVREGLKGQHV